jgi:hypothetical protein
MSTVAAYSQVQGASAPIIERPRLVGGKNPPQPTPGQVEQSDVRSLVEKQGSSAAPPANPHAIYARFPFHAIRSAGPSRTSVNALGQQLDVKA